MLNREHWRKVLLILITHEHEFILNIKMIALVMANAFVLWNLYGIKIENLKHRPRDFLSVLNRLWIKMGGRLIPIVAL